MSQRVEHANELPAVENVIVLCGSSPSRLAWCDENMVGPWLHELTNLTTNMGVLPIHIPVSVFIFSAVEDWVLFKLRWVNS